MPNTGGRKGRFGAQTALNNFSSPPQFGKSKAQGIKPGAAQMSPNLKFQIDLSKKQSVVPGSEMKFAMMKSDR